MNNTVRISLIGGTGTGKTAFMCGLVQALVCNVGKYGTPDDRCDVKLKLEKALSMKDDVFSDDQTVNSQSIVEGAAAANDLLQNFQLVDEFAESTTTSGFNEYEFSLTINNLDSCKMIIADYAGELISSYNSNVKSFPGLADRIADSDALILTVDGIEACKNYGHRNDLQRALSADFLTTFFPSVEARAKDKRKKMTILLAITKTDSLRIEQKYKEDNFADVSAMLVKDAYSTIYSACIDNDWNFGIIPVSCIGDNNSIPNSSGDKIKKGANIMQKNIDICILYSLYLNIENMIDDLENLLNELTEQTKLWNHPAGYKKSDWLKNINKCQANIERLRQCKQSLQKHTFADLNKMIHARVPMAAIPQRV